VVAKLGFKVKRDGLLDCGFMDLAPMMERFANRFVMIWGADHELVKEKLVEMQIVSIECARIG